MIEMPRLETNEIVASTASAGLPLARSRCGVPPLLERVQRSTGDIVRNRHDRHRHALVEPQATRGN